MPTLQDELLALFTDLDELRPALVAELVKRSESALRSNIEAGRWTLPIKLGCDCRVLVPDIRLPVSEALWTERHDALRDARAARRWADVSQVSYELLLLAPERATELSLDDDTFACLDFELPSPFEHQSAFLTRAYQLAVLYPARREEISAYDEYLDALLEALGRIPPPNYMDYPWLAAKLRVLYPDAELSPDNSHLRAAVRDCVIDLALARRGAPPGGFASKAAPLKLLAATRIELTDRGPIAVLR
jgi:hypothetical protein